jgi:hypothetical protein
MQKPCIVGWNDEMTPATARIWLLHSLLFFAALCVVAGDRTSNGSGNRVPMGTPKKPIDSPWLTIIFRVHKDSKSEIMSPIGSGRCRCHPIVQMIDPSCAS